VGRKVFLTADDLQSRIETTGAGVVELAANEVLTPQAKDLADASRIVVRRAVTAADPPSVQPIIKDDHTQAVEALTVVSRPPADRAVIGPVGLVVFRPTELVVTVLQALRHDGPTFVDYSQTDCWFRNTEALAAAIRDGEAAVGILMMRYAADAMVVAGKIKGLRPVQGTRPESVVAAVRRFNANILVLEHRLSTFHEMRAMIRAFTAARTQPIGGDVLATIDKHERR
jgi:ribose 5-phosphate isomerase RpiB